MGSSVFPPRPPAIEKGGGLKRASYSKDGAAVRHLNRQEDLARTSFKKRCAMQAPPGVENVTHHLFVFVAAEAACGPKNLKSRELSLAILTYVRDRVALFAEMGVRVQVTKITKKNLDNPRFVRTIRARGISSLPALATPNKIFIGNSAIEDVYERNIRDFEVWKRRAGDATPEDSLASFYQDEMSIKEADDDGDDDESVGEGGNMMNAYRLMMQKREKRDGAAKRDRRSSSVARLAPAPRDGVSSRALRSPRRPDNVAQDRRQTDDGPVFPPAGPADRLYEDEGPKDFGSSSQDDLMEKAYWANQEFSD